MAADLLEIVHNLRKQLAQRGGATLSSLALCFQVNDVNGDGIFGFTDFEQVLSKVGLFAKRQELTKLYHYFDPEGTEQLQYRDFLRELQGEVSARRMNMIKLVWDKLSGGQEAVPVKLVVGAFSAEHSRRVLSGEKSAEQVFREFVQSFENAGNVDGSVTWDIFAGYYGAISAAVPYDDDYFVDEIERAWGVQEVTVAPRVPTALVRKVENVIREKIRQRCKQEGRELEELRLTFKFFDLEHSGTVDYSKFNKALERFGINLSPALAEGLFADFADPETQLINYAEFVAALFHTEALVPSYKGISSTLPGASKNNQTVLFMVGGPSSAPGAFCHRASQRFGIVHLSPADLVKQESVRDTSTARAITQCETTGKPVPSQIKMDLLTKAMDKYTAMGKRVFVFEDFPKSLSDLQAWDMAANRTGGPDLLATILLDIPEHLMAQRMAVTDPKRLTIDARLDTYQTELLPLIGNLDRRGVLHTVDANNYEESVHDAVGAVIQSLLA